MANNFTSNFTEKLMKKVLARVEAKRVISKNVDTQLYKGAFNPDTGDTVSIKRPTRYKPARTADGNISASKRDIVTGKASAVVQDYISVAVDFNEADQALKMGTDMDRFFDDIARDIVIELEVDFAAYAVQNAGLLSGTYGQPIDSWQEVARAGAIMESTGVPEGDWNFALSPFAQVALANEQRSLGVNPEVATANQKALVAQNFAGMDVRTATALANVTTQAGADRVGALSANPDVTYVSAKDTMTQVLAVSGFQANLEIKAGEIIQITGRNRINVATGQVFTDELGANVVWSGVVNADVTLSGTGTGNITVTGPAIFEANSPYNTVDSAPVSGDVVTLLGSASTVYSPSLFWRRDAFSIAYINLEKLYSTDTIGTTSDGLQMRCSKYSDGDANKQTVRFDIRPAYGTNNPLYAGQAFGKA